MIIKETDGFYLHDESNFYLGNRKWSYHHNIKYSIKWFRKHGESLTFIINLNDKNREKNI